LNISPAFDKTLKRFNLSAKELAEKAGVTEGVISKFRNSRKRVYTDTLDKLLGALSKEAKIYFFSLLIEEAIDLDLIIARMDNSTLSKLLFIAADKINPEKKQETSKRDTESENLQIQEDDREDQTQVVVSGS